MTNYYERFPGISPAMSAEAILRALNEKAAGIANRFDVKSLETQSLIEEAKKVFRDEESKRAYDQALAESSRPKEDPLQKKREELEEWSKRARQYLKENSADLAKLAVERALALDEDCPGGAPLYLLASSVYLENEDFDAALQYINKTLLLDGPEEDPGHIGLKGKILGRKAWKLAQGERFSSSPELQGEYTGLRAKELEHLQRAYMENDGVMKAELADALDELVCALYYRFDQLDEAQAAEDRRQGYRYAEEVVRLMGAAYPSCAAGIHADYIDTKKRALSFRDRLNDGEKDDALSRAAVEAVEKVLELTPENAYLNWLAASIYYEGKINYDTALRYVDKALELKPWDACDHELKGLICGNKALRVSEDSRFRSSPELQREYRRLRSLELAELREARGLAEDQKDQERLAYVLSSLAFALYFRSDQLDADSAKKEKTEGIGLASVADHIRPGKCRGALRVLKDAGLR